jgi:membrane protein implicated in regulation of membrane protease activity
MLGGEGRALAGIITGAISVALGIVVVVLFVLWFGLSAIATPHTNFTFPSPTPSG